MNPVQAKHKFLSQALMEVSMASKTRKNLSSAKESREAGKGLPRIVGILLLVFCIVLIALSGVLLYKYNELQHNIETWVDYATALQGISGIGEPKPTHIHADFAVYVNGQRISFNVSEYHEKNDLTHIHLGNPEGDKTIHIHSTGITFGHFLRSLGMSLNSECFAMQSERFCNSPNASLKFYVNGENNPEYGDYYMHDLDKLLISYGNDGPEQIMTQISSVTDYSKLYSENPELG